VVPILLIICQRETGSALAYMALFFVLYREGMSGLVLLAAVAAVVIFVVAVKYTETVVLGMPQGVFIVITLIMLTCSAMSGLYARSAEIMRNVTLTFGLSLGAAFLLQSFGVELPWQWIFIGEIILVALYFLLMSLRNHAKELLVSCIFAVGSVAFLGSVNVLFDHMAPHQQNRILVSLGIKADPRGAGYNVNQSMIAIGSGGAWGKGFLNGTQTKLKYVPEQHTDFIFCTIGEEEGFWGTTLVLLLFLALIWRIIALAERQPTTFARVYAYSVASIFIFHLCINVGMVIGLCPVIGIPLPFFSYGGSSLWGFSILLFILLRLDAARKLARH
jgi:rod shape determining protein RodA